MMPIRPGCPGYLITGGVHEERGVSFSALAFTTEGSLSPLSQVENFLLIRLSRCFCKYGTSAALEELV